ncbi:hypothetical protein [Maliponia aquimaris]|uniref:Uncharacterized protein n=1 Tax=Maliponia aquimaris TaxID=1673631 RepID=A0A238K708_9RHOB|nr:hypothetical protein [Maliponia aquimaris]SMX38257.1 hypothetical protein MAA8898_01453 [Maliponia aquimaris]
MVLDDEARLLWRRRLVAAGGLAFVVDLEQTTALEVGAQVLTGGRREAIEAVRQRCEGTASPG